MNSISNIVAKLKESREPDSVSQAPKFMELKRAFSKYREFQDKNDSELRDLLDELDRDEKSYEIYNHKQSNGCTVFYESLDEDSEHTERLNAMKSNNIYKKIEAECKKFGYKLRSAYIDEGVVDISIINVDDNHPEIYYDYERYGETINEFRIQTWSVGSLPIDKYEVYLKGCTDAYNLVSAIKDLDFTKLYSI